MLTMPAEKRQLAIVPSGRSRGMDCTFIGKYALGFFLILKSGITAHKRSTLQNQYCWLNC